MRSSNLREGWIFAAAVLAGVNVYLVVQSLLPSGEEALPPLAAIVAEPPAPVYSVELPEPAAPASHRPARPETRVARTVSRPLGASRLLASTPPKPEVVRKSKPTPAPEVASVPPPQPAPVPAPVPAPEPEPRVLAMQPAANPAPTGNRSPGRAKHKNGPPPGQAQSAPQAPQDMNPVAAEAVLEPNPAPGREKHDNGLPPGQEKKDG